MKCWVVVLDPAPSDPLGFRGLDPAHDVARKIVPGTHSMRMAGMIPKPFFLKNVLACASQPVYISSQRVTY